MVYIQIQDAPGGNWSTLPEEEYFQMQTFGYRTRLFELLYYATDWPQRADAAKRELAFWIADRYKEKYPTRPAPVAVRFVAGLHRADPEKLPQGRWKKPSFEDFQKDDTYEIARYAMD